MIVISCSNRLLGVGGNLDEAIKDFSETFGIPMEIAIESVKKPDIVIAETDNEIWDEDGYMINDWVTKTKCARLGDGKKIF